MLILSRKTLESIIIGDKIELSIMEIKGDHVKIGIQAPRDVKVFRKEVFLAIQEENRAAALAGIDLPDLGGIIASKKKS